MVAWTAMVESGDSSVEGLEWPMSNLSEGYEAAGLDVEDVTNIGVVDYSVCEFWDYIAKLVECNFGLIYARLRNACDFEVDHSASCFKFFDQKCRFDFRASLVL